MHARKAGCQVSVVRETSELPQIAIYREHGSSLYVYAGGHMAHRVSLIAKDSWAGSKYHSKDQYIILYMYTTRLTCSYILHVSAQ